MVMDQLVASASDNSINFEATWLIGNRFMLLIIHSPQAIQKDLSRVGKNVSKNVYMGVQN